MTEDFNSLNLNLCFKNYSAKSNLMLFENFLIILHLVSTTKTIKETGKVKLKDDFLLEPRRMIKLFIAMKSFLHLQLFRPQNVFYV